MRSGRYQQAIDSWTKFLELVPGGPDALHNRAWTYMYLGAPRRRGGGVRRTWPYPVIAYMGGELSCDALVTAASNNDRKTGAHAYLGMDLLVGGRIADAREHFLWLKEYGNKRFLEYTLAVAELARLGL